MNEEPQDHVRSFDAALDKALGIVCGCAAVVVLMVIGGLVVLIVKYFEGRAGL